MTPANKAPLLLLLVCGACFSDRGAGPGVNTAAECRVPVTLIDSMHYLVALRNFAFHPDSIAVPVGATVTWVKCEDAGVEAHTTTSETPGIWDSPLLIPGARFTRRFPTGGMYHYPFHPPFHMSMLSTHHLHT